MIKSTKQLLDDRGVSPVIGVILMVAITVILAAVIGSFVLGIGGDVEKAPQASLTVDDGVIEHNGGDTLTASNIEVNGTSMGTSFSNLGPGDTWAVGGSGPYTVVHTPSDSVIAELEQ